MDTFQPLYFQTLCDSLLSVVHHPSDTWIVLRSLAIFIFTHIYFKAFLLAFLSSWNVLWFPLPMASSFWSFTLKITISETPSPMNPSKNHLCTCGDSITLCQLSLHSYHIAVILISLMFLLLVSPIRK